MMLMKPRQKEKPVKMDKTVVEARKLRLNTGESATEKSKYLHSMLTTLEKGSLRH